MSKPVCGVIVGKGLKVNVAFHWPKGAGNAGETLVQ